jgi:hypothetical protein
MMITRSLVAVSPANIFAWEVHPSSYFAGYQVTRGASNIP